MSVVSAAMAAAESRPIIASATARCMGSEARALSMLMTDRLNDTRSVFAISGANWRRN